MDDTPPPSRSGHEAVEAALLSRRSVRAFLPRPVPTDLLARLLTLAARAPSNSNTQPWHVHVLTGAPKQRLGEAIIALLGIVTDSPSLLVLAVFGSGIGTGGSQVGINALAAAFYPTASRATGVSWANGLGRAGWWWARWRAAHCSPWAGRWQPCLSRLPSRPHSPQRRFAS